MHVPLASLLFLLPPLFGLVSVQGRSHVRFLAVLSVLVGSTLLLATMGFAARKRKKTDVAWNTPLLLGFAALFLFSTCSTSSIASFAPWSIMYNTLALLMYGYALSLYVSASPKNLLLIAGVSLASSLLSMVFFPFSYSFLVYACLPVGVVLFEAKRLTKGNSASRVSLQSMLAHEIRTPLTIMQTTTTLLLEEVPGPLNARQKQFVKSNYEYTQRLITFSENMLMLLKSEKEFELKQKEKINIRLITQDMVAFFSPLLHIKQQTIRYSFPALLNAPLGDESMIRQVFINLIHNAVKHTKEGGYIIISVTQDDEQMVVSISDNGKGVEGEGRENLFKEFYQEKVVSEEFQDGFGMGLSIARQIIQKHGGKMYITSVKDKGTVVSFTLPAKAIR